MFRFVLSESEFACFIAKFIARVESGKERFYDNVDTGADLSGSQWERAARAIDLVHTKSVWQVSAAV